MCETIVASILFAEVLEQRIAADDPLAADLCCGQFAAGEQVADGVGREAEKSGEVGDAQGTG